MRSRVISESQIEYIVGLVKELLESVDEEDMIERSHGELADEWLAIKADADGVEEIATDGLREYLFG